MVPIDFVILIVLVIGVVRGVFTGGIKQVLSIAGVIVGLLLAVSLSQPLSNILIERNWATEALAPALSFIIVFFAIQGVVLLVSYLLRSALEKIKLGALDKIVGGIIGGGKAVLIVSLLLFLIRFVGIPGEDQRESSLFYDIVYPIMPATWDFIVGQAPDVSKTN